MSTILVTGGAGYVGSMVSRELLARGHRVVVADALLFGGEALLDLLSNPAFSFRKTDICVPAELEALFAAQRFDAVVHLASIVGDPACKAQPELATGPSGTARGACSSSASGTASAASSSPPPAATTARWRAMPCSTRRRRSARSASTRSSRSGSRSTSWSVPRPVDFTILRFATVYGLSLRPRFDLTINEFARDALLKGELEIFGPQFWRPYCHVRDIADAVAMVLEQDRERVPARPSTSAPTTRTTRSG